MVSHEIGSRDSPRQGPVDLWTCEDESMQSQLRTTNGFCQESGKENIFDLTAILPKSLRTVKGMRFFRNR